MFGLAVAFCFVAFAAGSDSSTRIVGGSDAVLGQFPYSVSLRSAANVHFCGGFIINSRWVASAAQCTANRALANTFVVAGTVSRTIGGDFYSAARIVNHPGFILATSLNDVSLIQTISEIIFRAEVQPISLGSTIAGGGLNAVVSGWGQTSNAGQGAETLQHVLLTTLTLADCRSRFSVVNANRVFDSSICTFTRIGEGTCFGDFGAPLVVNNEVIGIAAWNVPCGAGSPDVYTRISSFRPWIEQTMASF